MFLEISQNSLENTCARDSFLKKSFWHRYFPVNFAKFLITPFFTERLHLRRFCINRILNHLQFKLPLWTAADMIACPSAPVTIWFCTRDLNSRKMKKLRFIETSLFPPRCSAKIGRIFTCCYFDFNLNHKGASHHLTWCKSAKHFSHMSLANQPGDSSTFVCFLCGGVVRLLLVLIPNYERCVLLPSLMGL